MSNSEAELDKYTNYFPVLFFLLNFQMELIISKSTDRLLKFHQQFYQVFHHNFMIQSLQIKMLNLWNIFWVNQRYYDCF